MDWTGGLDWLTDIKKASNKTHWPVGLQMHYVNLKHATIYTQSDFDAKFNDNSQCITCVLKLSGGGRREAKVAC